MQISPYIFNIFIYKHFLLNFQHTFYILQNFYIFQIYYTLVGISIIVKSQMRRLYSLSFCKKLFLFGNIFGLNR